MALFPDDVQKQLSGILSQMQKEITLVFFTQEFECAACRDAHLFVDAIAELEGKIKRVTYDLKTDSERAEQYHVDKVPAILLLDENGKDPGIHFYGVPGGYEINSFLSAIMEVSGRRSPLPADLAKRIALVDKDVHIQVFVSLGCPHCPEAVAIAHRLALENDRIRADMVESSTFNHLAIRYNVSGVPKIIFNEKQSILGAQPVTAFLDAIEQL